jgi:hypothetical protein
MAARTSWGLTPNAFANFRIFEALGRLLAASQWEIVVTETPSSSANSACVRIANSRNCFNGGE